MELKVKLPMILKCDNKGTLDLSCNWSVGGSTCHVDVWLYMRQDLNKDKIIQMNWMKDEENSADLGTRNLNHASHTKHTKALCGDINKNFNFCHREGITRQQSRDLNTLKIVL